MNKIAQIDKKISDLYAQRSLLVDSSVKVDLTCEIHKYDKDVPYAVRHLHTWISNHFPELVYKEVQSDGGEDVMCLFENKEDIVAALQLFTSEFKTKLPNLCADLTGLVVFTKGVDRFLIKLSNFCDFGEIENESINV